MFCLENKSVWTGEFVFVMIAEIFWQIFWRDNWRSLIVFVENFRLFVYVWRPLGRFTFWLVKSVPLDHAIKGSSNLISARDIAITIASLSYGCKTFDLQKFFTRFVGQKWRTAYNFSLGNSKVNIQKTTTNIRYQA